MKHKQDSIENGLKTIRGLMQNSKQTIDDEVLELTEDDLVDELDEDAYEAYLK